VTELPKQVEIIKKPPQFKPPGLIKESRLRKNISNLARFLNESAALLAKMRHEPKSKETKYINGRLLREAEARVKKARKAIKELGVDFNREGLL
jgi:hypothetical protein